MRGVDCVDLIRSLRGSNASLRVVFDRCHNMFGVCHKVWAQSGKVEIGWWGWIDRHALLA